MKKVFSMLALAAMLLFSFNSCVTGITDDDDFTLASCPKCVLFFDIFLADDIRLCSDSVDVYLKDCNGDVNVIRKNIYYKDQEDTCPHFYLNDLRYGSYYVTIYADGLRSGIPVTLSGTANAVAKINDAVHVNLLLYDIGIDVMPWTGMKDEADF